jgi:hypothetical protein
LQQSRIRNRKQPLGRQPRDGGLVDLRQRRMPVPAGIAVVGWPLGLGRDRSKAISRAPQQVHALVAGQKLEVGKPLAEDLSLERAAIGRPNRRVQDRGGFALDRSQEFQQARGFGFGKDVSGHASERTPVVDQFR